MSDKNSNQSGGVNVLGPHIQRLETIADQSEKLELIATGQDGTRQLTLKVTQNRCGNPVSVQADPGFLRYSRSIGQGLLDLNAACRGLVLESIVAKGSKSPINGNELRRVVIAAWCEAAGMPIPSDAEMEKLLSSPGKKPEPKVNPRKVFVEKVRNSPDPAQEFNNLSPIDFREIAHLKKTDFSGLNLEGAQLPSFDFDSSNFENASMGSVNAFGCNFKRCSFKHARLNGAVLHQMRCLAADFTQADLSSASLQGATLVDAKFNNAKLSDCDLSFADLRGADLSGADLTGAFFDQTGFDEQTKFPSNFDFPKGLRWLGQGMDPLMVQQIKSTVAGGGSISFEEFLDRLTANFDRERIKKAMKMLQAERFQLFSEVKANSLVGIVKSQTDADLVYSCKLTDGGQFCCCTQNLNTCGGLRGALCKHLLVLLIGLTRAGELDPTTACAWVVASCMQKPVLDRDMASEVFLRYKGAEAGEIDWRPTETMPEDYYAF